MKFNLNEKKKLRRFEWSCGDGGRGEGMRRAIAWGHFPAEKMQRCQID